MAAYRGMHMSPAKHSYAWLPKVWLPKCDYQTDRQTHTETDAGQSDSYVPLCLASNTKNVLETWERCGHKEYTCVIFKCIGQLKNVFNKLLGNYNLSQKLKAVIDWQLSAVITARGVTMQEKHIAIYCDIFSLYCNILRYIVFLIFSVKSN